MKQCAKARALLFFISTNVDAVFLVFFCLTAMQFLFKLLERIICIRCSGERLVSELSLFFTHVPLIFCCDSMSDYPWQRIEWEKKRMQLGQKKGRNNKRKHQLRMKTNCSEKCETVALNWIFYCNWKCVILNECLSGASVVRNVIQAWNRVILTVFRFFPAT